MIHPEYDESKPTYPKLSSEAIDRVLRAVKPLLEEMGLLNQPGKIQDDATPQSSERFVSESAASQDTHTNKRKE